MGISDCSAADGQGLTVEHVERSARFAKRVNSNINRLRDTAKQLGRCSNRKIYYYTQADIDAIVAEVRKAADDIESAFRKANDAPARGESFDITIARRRVEQGVR